MRFVVAGLIASAIGGVAAPASALEFVLDFEGSICGENGRSACSNGSFIGQRYGDRFQAAVSYAVIDDRTGQPVEGLRRWGRQFGDLSGVVFGGYDSYNYSGQITVTATAGYGLWFKGLDVGCYRDGAVCQNFVYDINSLSGLDVAGGSVRVRKLTHTTLDFAEGYYTGFVLNWRNSYDSGLDNIRFDVKRVRGGALGAQPFAAVPEPGSWGLMVLGLGLTGAALRRRTTIRLAT